MKLRIDLDQLLSDSRLENVRIMNKKSMIFRYKSSIKTKIIMMECKISELKNTPSFIFCFPFKKTGEITGEET